jgi:hypothetical protein
MFFKIVFDLENIKFIYFFSVFYDFNIDIYPRAYSFNQKNYF